jgi:hypothetical protein
VLLLRLTQNKVFSRCSVSFGRKNLRAPPLAHRWRRTASGETRRVDGLL